MSSSSSSPAAATPLTDKLSKLPHLPENREQLKEELKAEAQEGAQKSLSGLRSLVAGGFGGVCAVLVGHPFDLVKVRLQTAERGVYSGALDVVRKSVAKDGLGRGLYAGVSAPLVGVTPMCTLSLFPFVLILSACPCSKTRDLATNFTAYLQLLFLSGVMMLERAWSADSQPSRTIPSPLRRSLPQDSSLRSP